MKQEMIEWQWHELEHVNNL